MSIVPLDAPRLNAALDELALVDADISQALARIGYPQPRLRPPGFATLLQIVTAQQISTKAAAAIWGRLELACAGLVTPEALLALDDAGFRRVGFSLRKAVYAQALARALLEGELDLDGLALIDEAEALARLVALKGFGRWSAEIYLLFALGRIDCFPAGDLALQIGFQRLKRLEARPSADGLRELVAPWAPRRGAAALFLWHYYGAATLDGTTPIISETQTG